MMRAGAARHDAQEAAAEDRLRQFFAAYDALLDRWPAGWQPVDIASVYGTTRVNISGPQDAPPLLLFSGFGATSAVWFAMVGELSRTYRVHAVDHIGDAGRSVAAGRPVGSAADLMDWADSLPWSRPVFTRRPPRARLGSLTVPTLVVLAEQSKAHNIRRVAGRARTMMPRARFEVLPGASHHSIPAGQAGPLSQLLLGLRPDAK